MDLAMGHNSFRNEVLMNCLERRVSKTILSRILYMIYSCKEYIIIIFVPIKLFYAKREIRYLNLFMSNTCISSWGETKVMIDNVSSFKIIKPICKRPRSFEFLSKFSLH